MQVKVLVIDFQFSPRARRAIVTIALPIAVFFGSAATLAIAGGVSKMGKVQPAAIDTGWIDAGLPVSAGNLAANLNGLQSQSTALQNQLSFNGTYSLGADFCKETPGNFTGAVVAGGTGENGAGWAAAKAACVTTCGGSSTAHMCTTEELVRHFALGEPALTPNSAAWFASGVLGTTASGGDSDCYGWTVGDSTSYGGLWEGYYSTAGACNGSFPIACCDWP